MAWLYKREIFNQVLFLNLIIMEMKLHASLAPNFGAIHIRNISSNLIYIYIIVIYIDLHFAKRIL
jgi:hypothetical protein